MDDPIEFWIVVPFDSRANAQDVLDLIRTKLGYSAVIIKAPKWPVWGDYKVTIKKEQSE